MSAKNLSRYLVRFATAGFLSALTLAIWTAERLWPREMSTAVQNRVPRPRRQGRHVVVPIAAEVACAEIASFDDQLEAVLRFEYLRGNAPANASKMLLTS